MAASNHKRLINFLTEQSKIIRSIQQERHSMLTQHFDGQGVVDDVDQRPEGQTHYDPPLAINLFGAPTHLTDQHIFLSNPCIQCLQTAPSTTITTSLPPSPSLPRHHQHHLCNRQHPLCNRQHYLCNHQPHLCNHQHHLCNCQHHPGHHQHHEFTNTILTFWVNLLSSTRLPFFSASVCICMFPLMERECVVMLK